MDRTTPATKPSDTPEQANHGISDWLENNILTPAVNGSGVLQIYNTFASKPVELHEEKGNWAVQTLSGAAGAIIPYVVAGKLAGSGMKAVGESIGLEGAAARVMASDSVAQIAGAGIYEAFKKPNDGETRLGNSLGTMASFALFEKGNSFLNGKTFSSDAATNFGLKAAARFGVGAAGGLVNYDGSHAISDLVGVHSQTNWSDRVTSMASGGFINVALPAVQQGVGKAIESLVGSGRGVTAASSVKENGISDTSVDRAIYKNPFATIKEASAKNGDMKTRIVQNSAEIVNPDATTKTELTTKDKAPEVAKASDAVPGSHHDLPAFDTTGKLGATVMDNGVQFAAYSENATKMEVLVFNGSDPNVPSQVLPMEKTGSVWHTFGEDLPNGTKYLYRAYGSYSPETDGSRFNANLGLLDVYSHANTGDTKGPTGFDNSNPEDPNKTDKPATTNDYKDMPRSIAFKPAEFDWQGDKPLQTPIEETNVYEINLRGYTANDTSLGNAAGTFRGLISKIPFFNRMGYSAIELMPIMEYDRDINLPFKDPVTGKQLTDSWDYNPVAYQAPDGSLAADGSNGQQINEFKEMVRELHKNNTEVILDIVFNHTRENGATGPTVNFKGLDNKTYYMLNPDHPEQYVDHSGVGNTLNVNHPAVQKMILDTLRYWVDEMHVDGFRFDLASVFNYDVDGQDKQTTPIIQAIQNDPVLQGTKLIAEPWSVSNYKLGHFSDSRWGEWNGSFRDVVRKFIKGDSGQTGALADRIAGSPGWFDRLKGRFSVNFVACHDGFTLNDLVSYNTKHNDANGEQGRDGSNDNLSWNHGIEGPTEGANIPDSQKAEIEALREKQIRNFGALTYLSQGVPQLLGGDEMRRTAFGNNNAWNNDRINAVDWSLLDKNAGMVRYFENLIGYRKDAKVGYSTPADIRWHGTDPNKPDFSDGSRFIAWQYEPTPTNPKTIYTASNAYWEPLTVHLPEGTQWSQVIDTSKPAGEDIVPISEAKPVTSNTITIQPRSVISFVSDTSKKQ